MRKYLLFILPLILFSCTSNGDVFFVEQAAKEYEAISCNCPIDITLSSQCDKIIIEANESVQKDIVFKYSNNTLDISIDKLIYKKWNQTPHISLPMPKTLKKVRLYSTTNFNSDGVVYGDSVAFVISGGAKIDMDLVCEKVYIESYSYSTIFTLRGSAKYAYLKMNSTTLNGYEFEVERYRCSLYTSNIDINCSRFLTITNANNSNINYIGECDILQQNIYNSNITKIEND